MTGMLLRRSKIKPDGIDQKHLLKGKVYEKPGA